MTIRRDDVLRIARLAQLDLAPAELPELTRQLDQIVGYVGQLGEAVVGDAPAAAVGPAAAPLREDVIDPIPLERRPAEWAAEFETGFFTVPRLRAMDPG